MNLPNGILGAIIRLKLLIIMGLAFGWLFERSHVYEPDSIRQQFIFSKNIMLKMFMGAVGGGCFSFYVWDRLIPGGDAVLANIRRCRSIGSSVVRSVIGGAVLGCGMVVAGACPGMVLPQVGTGVHHAYITLAGGFAGALFHNLLKFGGVLPSPSPTTAVDDDKFKNDYADLRFGIDFHKCMLLFGGFCAAFCIVMEILIDYETELTPGTKGAWPPSIAGFGIGLINLFSIAIARQAMGSSTGYAQIVFQTTLLNKDYYGGKGKSSVQMDSGVESGAGGNTSGDASPTSATAFSRSDSLNMMIAKYWQIPYLCCSILGAYLSKEVAGNTAAIGIPDAKIAFLGGFLMLFGSRLGGGCTSGHGIAGMPLLFLPAIFAVCAMFGCGIVLGVGMDAAGELALTGKR